MATTLERPSDHRSRWSWIETATIDHLIGRKAQLLESGIGGVTIDHETIGEEMEDDGEIGNEALSRWFDVCIDRLICLSGTSFITVHRAVAVDDVDVAVAETRLRRQLGCHWTWDRDSAATDYGSGPMRFHDIMFEGCVAASDIDWFTTLQQAFSHPHEREITMNGDVVLRTIMDMTTGRMHDMSGITCNSHRSDDDD